MKTFEASAIISPAYGFIFDASNSQSELENIQQVISKYYQAFGCGLLDIDIYYPKFLEELRQAGSEKLVEEVQRQINIWHEQFDNVARIISCWGYQL